MKPIIFSTDMVKAILEGRKTQTRRVMKPQPKLYRDKEWTYSKKGFHSHYSAMLANDKTFFGWIIDTNLTDEPMKKAIYRHNPYGVPGDKLWVKEGYDIRDIALGGIVKGRYSADNEYFHKELSRDEYKKLRNRKYPYRKSPGRFMYKSLSRITLEIKDVRVERVQDISAEDIVTEGAWKDSWSVDADYSEAYEAWMNLWNSINEKRGYGWGVNPFCWVIDFLVVGK